jgi:outer membrane protein assembly factor BamD (BamD/ComL family)
LGHIYISSDADFKKALEQFDLAQKESNRSAVRDSLTYWLNNLKEWDKLNFEESVFQKAFAKLDPASNDTVGEYAVEENDKEKLDFDIPTFVTFEEQARLDSLKRIVYRDSVRIDSLWSAGQEPAVFFAKRDSTIADSLRDINLNPRKYFASRDSVRTIAYQTLGLDRNAFIYNRNRQNDQGFAQSQNLNTGQDRTRGLTLPGNTQANLQNKRQEQKTLKKVTVPKNPTKLRQKLVEASNRIAELYLFQFNMPDSALSAYENLVELFPENSQYPHWLFSIAYIQEQNKNLQMRDSIYQVILENYSETEYAAQIQKKMNQEEVEKKEPDKDMFNLAEEYLFEKEMMDSSIYVYQKLVEMYPESELAPKSLYSIAYIYDWFKNDSSQALKHYRQLVTQYPGSDYAKQGQKKINAVKQFKQLAEQKEKAKKQAIEDSLKMIASDSTQKQLAQKDTTRHKGFQGTQPPPELPQIELQQVKRNEQAPPEGDLDKSQRNLQRNLVLPDTSTNKTLSNGLQNANLPDSVKTAKKPSPDSNKRLK